MKLILVLASVCLCMASVSGVEIVCPTDQADLDMVIQYPSATSCSEFFKCDRGVAVLQWCPEGLHYNTFLQSCDYPEMARCTLKSN
uniref:Chitin-binding type-2 domain-containing protein n=1 Tax=Eristalis tenax TaxID=198635 RepID=A4VBA4_ERITN|nr:hypothetical protein [Eristalis tenax]